MSDTTSTTDMKARAAVTAGLRALADYPRRAPRAARAAVQHLRGPDRLPGRQRGGQARRGRPHRQVLQVVTEDFGVYQAERRFGGPVAYRVARSPKNRRRSGIGEA